MAMLLSGRSCSVTVLVSTISVLLFLSPVCSTDSQNSPVPAPECKECLVLESFENGLSWVQSSDSKYNGKVEIVERDSQVIEGDHGLLLPVSHRFYGLTKKLDKPVENDENTFVVQYELTLLDKLDCGGAYIKLLSHVENFDASSLRDNSPYSIMFGPDRCGSTNKIHVIFRHENKVTKEVEEKHLKRAPTFPNDRLPHLYTLIVRKDNTFAVLVDNEVKREGSLFEEFEPSFQPPETIDDPTDSKPEDWVDDEEIPDATAVKPEDWDEDAPLMIEDSEAVKPSGWLDDEEPLIPDPDARKPDDWDDEEDGDFEPPLIANPNCKVGCGEWKRPMIRNPLYKGKWSAPMVPNPAYKGEWAPRQIPNPAYYKETNPASFTPIGAIALELWTTNKDLLFDNFLITRSPEAASEYATKTWKLRHEKEKAALEAERKKMIADRDGIVNRIQEFAEEYPLYAVLAISTLLIPFIVLCRRGAPRSYDEERRRAAEHKKDDDAPNPSDEAESEEEQGDEAETMEEKEEKEASAAEEPKEEAEEDIQQVDEPKPAKRSKSSKRKD